MTTTAARIRPSVEVLPAPTVQFPGAYALVSAVVLPTYAGHWGQPGTAHAGMWVMSFPDERGALAAAARLRHTGHVA